MAPRQNLLRDTDRAAWLDACEQIRQLASRYAIAIGHGDLDALVSLFVDDVRVGADDRGRDALRANFEQQLAPLGSTILHVTNHAIDVESPTEATGIVGTRAEMELGGEWITQLIEYRDTYACRGGEWLFVRRRHHLWYGAPIGTSPLDLSPANWPDNATGRGDLMG